jgi:hypothetical protein
MIAVFPTPAGPTSAGLFFVRLLRIWIVRRISSSLPMTGSNFPSLAFSVRSCEYFLSVSPGWASCAGLKLKPLGELLDGVAYARRKSRSGGEMDAFGVFRIVRVSILEMGWALRSCHYSRIGAGIYVGAMTGRKIAETHRNQASLPSQSSVSSLAIRSRYRISSLGKAYY